MVPETEFYFELTQLITLEDFITSSCCESFKSYFWIKLLTLNSGLKIKKLPNSVIQATESIHYWIRWEENHVLWTKEFGRKQSRPIWCRFSLTQIHYPFWNCVIRSRWPPSLDGSCTMWFWLGSTWTSVLNWYSRLPQKIVSCIQILQ